MSLDFYFGCYRKTAVTESILEVKCETSEKIENYNYSDQSGLIFQKTPKRIKIIKIEVICAGWIFIFVSLSSIGPANAIGIGLLPSTSLSRLQLKDAKLSDYWLKKPTISEVVEQRAIRLSFKSHKTSSEYQIALLLGNDDDQAMYIINSLRGGSIKDVLVIIAVFAIGSYLHLAEGFLRFGTPPSIPPVGLPTPWPSPKPISPHDKRIRSQFQQDVIWPVHSQESAFSGDRFEPSVSYTMAPTEARDLVNSRFGGRMEIIDGFAARKRQLAAKIYHAPEFGLKPEDYGMTSEELELIRQLQLVEYTARGHKLPPNNYIGDFANKLKEHCSLENIIPDNNDSINEDGSPRKAHSFGDPLTYRKVFFDPYTGEFISGWEQTQTKFQYRLSEKSRESEIANSKPATTSSETGANIQPSVSDSSKKGDI
jgi:hypothetical protein